jgi:hypothetical protein
MRKITLFLILICPIFISCENDKIGKLQAQIDILENQNADLKKSLQKDEFEKFTSSYFITSTVNDYLTVNRKGMVKISLITIDTIPEFDVYSIDENNNRSLVMENINKTEFNYSFTPTSIKDNKIDLMAELELPSGTIAFPIFGKVDVRE